MSYTRKRYQVRRRSILVRIFGRAAEQHPRLLLRHEREEHSRSPLWPRQHPHSYPRPLASAGAESSFIYTRSHSSSLAGGRGNNHDNQLMRLTTTASRRARCDSITPSGCIEISINHESTTTNHCNTQWSTCNSSCLHDGIDCREREDGSTTTIDVCDVPPTFHS